MTQPVNPKIYLASRSPRRAKLLQQIGVNFAVLPSDIDESVLPNEQPQAYVLRLAHAKAQACQHYLQASALPQLPILAADTTVSLDGQILGKPETVEEARSMLSQMSGRWHEVHTGLALATEHGITTALSSTRVEMAELSEAEISAYIASGEPFDKAGAYGIQGLAGVFIRRIEGSYSGVMGLPIYETAALLKQAGIQVL
ncbi:MAG: septum formation inhibitor Maf [Methylophilaceae bacterium]|nr:septum formation inhibitor Maf [Methylophilaceae bacterium]